MNILRFHYGRIRIYDHGMKIYHYSITENCGRASALMNGFGYRTRGKFENRYIYIPCFYYTYAMQDG